MVRESDPIGLFSRLFEEMSHTDVIEPAAVVLASADSNGKPAARVVLLKTFDERGFVIYTNLHSQKGRELKANPFAALCFYWEPIHYQVRIAGPVEQVSDSEADTYFANRARGSQIGAWASRQSATLEDRRMLEARVQELERKHAGNEIPRPDFWSGFRVIPQSIEFWERQENRLHERLLYTRRNNRWESRLLYP